MLVFAVITVVLVCLPTSPMTAAPELTHTRLFENHDQSFYRIPALAVSTKGTLLAVCNDRVGTPEDGCPYIRLHLRRSTDNGKTWGPLQTMRDQKGWRAQAGAGIVDPTTGEIMFFYTWDPGTEEARLAHKKANPEFDASKVHHTEWIARSTDDGMTWKHEPRKIDLKNIKWCSTSGSDTGIVVRSGKNQGRLLMAARASLDQRVSYELCRKNRLIVPRVKGNGPVGHNCTVYSDDHGKTWTAGGAVQPQTGEGCVAELSDGTIYFNSRASGGWRLEATSKDTGENFSYFATSPLVDQNFGTAASILSVPKEAHGRSFVLFTNPTHNEFGWSVFRDRKKFTASVSFDDAKTWPLKKLIFKGPSGYSASVMSKDGDFFVLYEKGKAFYRDTGVSIVKFNVEWLTDGKALTAKP
jgi:sialidase-1